MGPLAKLMLLLRREAPAQADVAREALRRAAQVDREMSVVGAADAAPLPSKITVGARDRVTPNPKDVARAKASGRSVLDFHTHPAAYEGNVFGVSPSGDDLKMYANDYPDMFSSGTELRTLIAMPPSRPERTAYHFFATDDPATILSPTAADAARYELQRAGSRGRFSHIIDDPLFRDYFEYGGDIGDLLAESSVLGLLARRAQQGRGRQELMLPTGNTVTPLREATPAELYRRMEPAMLEVLRERNFARGGLAQAKECSCHG
jgi:hypothetical protein